MSTAVLKKPRSKTAKDTPVKAAVVSTTAAGTTPRPVDALTARKQFNDAMSVWQDWRAYLNPLRGLTLQRAVYLLESYERGIVADFAWTLRFVEKSDADLMALIARRTSALLQMDWTIKVPAKDRRGQPVDQTLAKAQADVLWQAYEGIDNLKAAIRHLALATFRGYAHCEKWVNADGDITHLEIVEPWNVCRNRLANQWKYNPQAIASDYTALPAEQVMDPADFLIRTVDLPVGRIALLKFIRENLAQKDWDAFVEIYGIPGWIIVGPPNVPKEREAEYQAAAQSVSQGGSGYLPNGSTATAADGPRGMSPFKERMDYLSEKLILAGTGGLLTMLAASGTGTLAGNAHQETFEIIVRGEAAEINEVFQQQLDAAILAVHFPGEARLAYFEITANEETDVESFIGDVEKLGRAGYQVSESQIEEKTGYQATLKPDQLLPKGSQPVPAGSPAVQPGTKAEPPPVRNRATDAPDDADQGEFLANCRILLGDAQAEKFEPLALAMQTVLDKSDVEFPVAWAVLKTHFPTLSRQILAAPNTTAAFCEILAPALVDGLVEGAGDDEAPETDGPIKNKKAASLSGGHWVTIDGTHVFIKSGKGGVKAAQEHHPRDSAGKLADLAKGDGWTQRFDDKAKDYKPGWSEHGMKLNGFTTPAIEKAKTVERRGQEIERGPNAPKTYDERIDHSRKYIQPIHDAYRAAEDYASP